MLRLVLDGLRGWGGQGRSRIRKRRGGGWHRLCAPTWCSTRSSKPSSTAELEASKPPEPGTLGPIERWVIDAGRIASEEELATVCIFRGRGDDGVGVYRFSEDLGSLSPMDLAEQMLMAQLLGRLGYVPPVEYESSYHQLNNTPAAVAGLA